MGAIDFDTSHLTGEARTLADTIVRFIVEQKAGDAPYGGGSQVFYEPSDWLMRGHRYGHGSVLVLVHEGGDLAPYCNYDYGAYGMIETFANMLKEHGVYVENCTGAYSAVYPITPRERSVSRSEATPEGTRQLTRDLAAARAVVAEVIRGVADGGTSNLDIVEIDALPPRTTLDDLAAAGEDGSVISPPTDGQGWLRTRAAEALSRALNELGWRTHVRYVVD